MKKIIEVGELVKREYRTKDMLAAEQAVEGKLSRKLTPEQDKQSQNKVAEIKKLKQEGEAIAERFNKPFQPGAKQIKLENELRNDIKPVVDSFVENRTKALFDPIPADAKNGNVDNTNRLKRASKQLPTRRHGKDRHGQVAQRI